MHNYHTENFYFHANGDPIPGDVLIKKISAAWDGETFRTTAEEIVTFCAAHRLEALGRSVTLRTTLFEIDGAMVTLRVITPQTPEDAWNIQVPMTDLQSFAAQAVRRRFEFYLEECAGDCESDSAPIMAGIGLFAHLQRK